MSMCLQLYLEPTEISFEINHFAKLETDRYLWTYHTCTSLN